MELPTPPRPETPNEPSSYDQFTVVQLIALHQQLRSIAPSGVVMYKILVDTVYSLSHTSVSTPCVTVHVLLYVFVPVW